ncbi:phosphate transporter 1 [Striga asiatica]|uniref:Phosphate transporter 1 n=1 Tax=Striga asiatica TaxID=4170 RepID=A0A5A7PAC7_STRAF|nr:phosphate transporter 1 [Striga asiatica]
MGFFTDAYDLFCISLVTKMLGRIYYHVPGSPKPGSLPPNVSSAVNGVALVGTLAGQLFFGWLGDKLGRKKVYGATLALMCACSIASGLSFGSTPKSVMSTLCFFRFWLGFGIGGDYPLSATIMSEYANKKTRGAFIAAVFAMQGFGILAGGIFGMVMSAAFESRYPSPAYEVDPVRSTPPEADYVWRIILMAGAIPALCTFYSRMKMPETARYTALVAKDAKQAASDMSKVLNMDIEAEQAKVEKIERKSAYGLFSRDAIGWIPKAKTMSAIREVFTIARAQTLIALCSTVPGYWFTVALIDVIGRFAIQLIGFFFMTVFMFALAFPYNHWIKPDNRIGFVVMYSLTFFFANFGPNATTFVVPAEIFPARLRSTCHGISAAAGKLGAIVGAFGFLYLAQNQDPAKADPGYPAGIGVKNSLILLGVVNLLGLLFTFLVPESKGKSLEEMSGENEENNDEGEGETRSAGAKLPIDFVPSRPIETSSYAYPPPQFLIARSKGKTRKKAARKHNPSQPINLKSLFLRMDSEGQRISSNPSAMLATLLCKRAKLHEDLRIIEKQVYDMETSYLQDPSQCGNVLKGFEGFLSSSKNTTLLKRSRKFQPEDRLFSLSSVTSPAAEEVARDGGVSANGPGKPRKGRVPREAKRRQSSEADFDYEEDPDLICMKQCISHSKK